MKYTWFVAGNCCPRSAGRRSGSCALQAKGQKRVRGPIGSFGDERSSDAICWCRQTRRRNPTVAHRPSMPMANMSVRTPTRTSAFSCCAIRRRAIRPTRTIEASSIYSSARARCRTRPLLPAPPSWPRRQQRQRIHGDGAIVPRAPDRVLDRAVLDHQCDRVHRGRHRQLCRRPACGCQNARSLSVPRRNAAPPAA